MGRWGSAGRLDQNLHYDLDVGSGAAGDVVRDGVVAAGRKSVGADVAALNTVVQGASVLGGLPADGDLWVVGVGGCGGHPRCGY